MINRTATICMITFGAVLWPLHGALAHLPHGLGIMCIGLLLSAVIFERDDSPVTSEAHVKQRPALRGEMPRALIVGAGAVGRALAQNLEGERGYVVVGFVDDDPFPVESEDERWPILGEKEEVASLVRKFGIDAVFLAYAPTWQQRLVEELTGGCPDVAVCLIPSPYEALMRTARVENFADLAVVRLTEPQGRAWDGAKRIVDIVAAILGLIFWSPVLALAALAVRLTSPGPVIFAQKRIGRGGKPFTLYKFRTMIHNAEERTGPILSDGKSDPRVTPVGRLFRMCRIDEIPQLWNVLRGEMSLVGPRPERPVFVEKFARAIPLYALRHEVRPGITGLAQVCGGYKTDARDKLRFDLIYVAHRSPWMDIKILARTILVVLSSRGS